MIHDNRLSGMEMLVRLRDGVLPMPSTTEIVPFTIAVVERGRIELEASPDDRHLNLFGVAFGGWAMTVLDYAAGFAAYSAAEAGEICPSADMNVKFLRPITAAGAPFRAIGLLVQAGRTIIHSEGQLFDAMGRIVANCTTSCIRVSTQESERA